MTNMFYDGYCAHKLPCGYCERTGKRCFLEASVTWGVGTSKSFGTDMNSTSQQQAEPQGTITEAWNGTADAGYSDA